MYMVGSNCFMYMLASFSEFMCLWHRKTSTCIAMYLALPYITRRIGMTLPCVCVYIVAKILYLIFIEGFKINFIHNFGST